MAEEITSAELVGVVSGQILSGPEDSIFDDMFDWIQNVIEAIGSWIRSWWTPIWEGMKQWFSDVWASITSPIKTGVDWIKLKAEQIWDWVVNIYTKVSDWVGNAWNTITSAVSGAISIVWTWLQNIYSGIADWVAVKVAQVWTWITTSIANLGSTIWGWLQETRAAIWGWIERNQEMLTNLTLLIPGIGWMVRGYLFATETTILGHHDQTAADIKDWIGNNVKVPIIAWWDDFMENLGDILNTWWETIWGWLKTAWESIVHFFSHTLVEGVMNALGWLRNLITPVVESVLGHIMDLLRSIAPLSPEGGTSALSGLANIGLVMGGGLAAMTVAGHLIHPLKTIGLGEVSAMIWDMSNYKLILGAFMGVVAYTAIRTPLTYYLNDMLRPRLLEVRDFMQLLSRQAFRDPQTLQNPELTTSVLALTGGQGEAFERRMIGYYGYPDQYHGFYKELAVTPLRYFPLAGIARTGFFEEVWFKEALHRSGYSKTAIDALMVMYKKMVDENVQGSMSGAAVKRFKEGLTTEDQFSGELMMLGYSEEQIPKYMAAARMDYAYDYTMDLISAYRDAVRKGNLSIDEYRGALLDLGIVPERVEGYVLRERARLKPKEPLTPIAPMTPIFETDAGRVMVDTLRRLRRKLLISRDQEAASLIELGMEPFFAAALADNDDVRLAEKGGEES